MIAAIAASAAVFLFLVIVAVLVIAAYLVIVIVTLQGVSRRLVNVLACIDVVTSKTGPAAPVIVDINRDLAAGRQALEDCVERLQARQVPATAAQPPRYP